MPHLQLHGRTIEVSSPEKLLFPDAGLTKGDLVDYYRRIAPRMVPHLQGRPLMTQHFPRGIDAPGFHQQNAPESYPDWIRRAPVAKLTADDGDEQVTHVVCDDDATLVYLANQNCITPHAWLSRADRPHHPDRLVFDLDPPEDRFDDVRRGARLLRELLDALGLSAFVMTTGSKGLHVVTPLDRSAEFDEVRAFARAVAERLASRLPDVLTVEHRKQKRRGRVFVDVLRNAYGQTAVPPYAVRALPGAPVATPLDWAELDRAGLHARRYSIRNVFRRLGQMDADPWAGLERQAQSLADARRRLDAMGAPSRRG